MILLIMLLIFSTCYVVYSDIPDENKTTFYIALVVVLVVMLLFIVF